MKTSVSSKGQIVLPAALRARDGIVPGQQFEVERLQPGEYLLRRLPQPGEPGLVAWLRNCPAQDWYQRVPSESTDAVTT